MTAFAFFCAGFGCGVLALFLTLLAYREPSARCASPSPDEGYPSMPILEGFQPIIDELNTAAQAIASAKAAAASLPQAQDVADTLSAVSSAAQAVVLASTVTPPPV